MLDWMIYVALVALLVAVAALCAEKVARLQGLPSRWIWVAAMIASLLIPVLIAAGEPVIGNRAEAARDVPLAQASAGQLSPTNWIFGYTRKPLTSPAIDTALRSCWGLASGTLLFLLICSGAQLRLRRRRWTTRTVAGTAVFVAPDIGPAVVGLLRPCIVLPGWLLELPESQQTLVIAHERSHLEAHDPWILAVALAILVCTPWNLPLWWQWRRLRRCVEVDCDLRVLRSGEDARSYGETLLAVGQRQSTSISVVTAMSEPRSFLEERITIMLRKTPESWRLLAAMLGCLSLTLGAFATQVAPPPGNSASQPVLVPVPTTTLESYSGYYDYGGAAVVEVKRDGQHLTVQFSGARSADPVYPQSPTTFFYLHNDAQLSFAADAAGHVTTATLHQNGANTPMSRIEAPAVEKIRAALDTKVQAQAPSPGSEAMLRRLIAGITSGAPNLQEMNPQLAAAIHKDLPKLQVKLSELGAVQSIRLLEVTRQGMDVYQVQHERGSSQWSIELSPSGTLVGAFVPL